MTFWTFFFDVFCPFTPAKTQKIKILKKWKKTFRHVWFLRYGAGHTIFCHIRPFFALLPPNKPENQNFAKIKKLLDISSFYTSVPKIMIICYTVLEIWHMTDVIFIFDFGLFFALLPPMATQKSKFKRKLKKRPQISFFYTCVTKIMITWCTVLKIWSAMDRWTDRQTDRWKKWHIEWVLHLKNRHVVLLCISKQAYHF